MIGKQVRFFMLAGDEERFLKFIYQDLSSRLILSPDDVLKLVTIRRLSDAIEACRGRLALYIAQSSFRVPKNLITKHVVTATGEIVYGFDYTNAPVIEFRRSFLAEGKLVKGRLWASMYTFTPDTMTRKDDEFIKWYDQIARWIRRHGKRIQGLDGYVFDDAMEWHKKGGVLRAY